MINSHLLPAEDQLVKSQLVFGRYHVKVEAKVAALLKRGIRTFPALQERYFAKVQAANSDHYLNGRVGSNRTGFESVRVGSSNLSTSGNGLSPLSGPYCQTAFSQSNWSARPRYSVARDFKSLGSISERRLVRANAGIWSRRVRISRRRHDNRSHSPGLVTGFSSRQHPEVMSKLQSRCYAVCALKGVRVQVSPSYQQKAVKNPNNPRINATALAKLSTHKRNRFGLKARINATAFTHKHNRLYASRLRDNWSTATSPVSTSITNNPIVKNKTYIGYAKIRINSYE